MPHNAPPPAPVPPPDYATIELNLWQANAIAVGQELQNIRNGDRLSKKIDSFAQRFNYPHADIETEIGNNSMFAAAFAKNPVNTAFDKDEARQWLSRQLNAQIEELPKKAKDAFYVADNGDIRLLLPNEANPSKALTFRWQMNNLTFYALHKYTGRSGGAQRNQFREEQRALKNFQNARDPDTVLIVIVDGDYYTSQKMNQLRQLTRDVTPKSFAVHIEDVPWAIRQCP